MTGIAKKDLLMKRKHLEIGLFSKFSSIQIQAVFVISNPSAVDFLCDIHIF